VRKKLKGAITEITKTRMWANAQRDGRPAEYRWRPLCNAAVLLTPTTTVPCSNATKTRNPLKFAGVPQTPERMSAASVPKFTIRTSEEILLFNIFSDCRYVPELRRYSRTTLCDGAQMANFFGDFFAFCIFSEPRAACFRPAS